MYIDEDSLGYVWRKYGEKTVGARKEAVRRSYYRCVGVNAHAPCLAKKRVDRLASAEAGDAPLSTCYINRHNHAPKRRGHSLESCSTVEEIGWDYEESGNMKEGLEGLRAEDLAREMYSDLMVQLHDPDQHVEATSPEDREVPSPVFGGEENKIPHYPADYAADAVILSHEYPRFDEDERILEVLFEGYGPYTHGKHSPKPPSPRPALSTASHGNGTECLSVEGRVANPVLRDQPGGKAMRCLASVGAESLRNPQRAHRVEEMPSCASRSTRTPLGAGMASKPERQGLHLQLSTALCKGSNLSVADMLGILLAAQLESTESLSWCAAAEQRTIAEG